MAAGLGLADVAFLAAGFFADLGVGFLTVFGRAFSVGFFATEALPLDAFVTGAFLFYG